jgi:hypothetical protein
VFEVADVPARLAPYEVATDAQPAPLPDEDVAELVERAVTLLRVMPANQRRETVEDLLCPHDPEKGRRAVDALIESAFAAEDDAGRLHRLG